MEISIQESNYSKGRNQRGISEVEIYFKGYDNTDTLELPQSKIDYYISSNPNIKGWYSKAEINRRFQAWKSLVSKKIADNKNPTKKLEQIISKVPFKFLTNEANKNSSQYEVAA